MVWKISIWIRLSIISQARCTMTNLTADRMGIERRDRDREKIRGNGELEKWRDSEMEG